MGFLSHYSILTLLCPPVKNHAVARYHLRTHRKNNLSPIVVLCASRVSHYRLKFIIKLRKLSSLNRTAHSLVFASNLLLRGRRSGT
jgi:hypothetical protein